MSTKKKILISLSSLCLVLIVGIVAVLALNSTSTNASFTISYTVSGSDVQCKVNSVTLGRYAGNKTSYESTDAVSSTSDYYSYTTATDVVKNSASTVLDGFKITSTTLTSKTITNISKDATNGWDQIVYTFSLQNKYSANKTTVAFAVTSDGSTALQKFDVTGKFDSNALTFTDNKTVSQQLTADTTEHTFTVILNVNSSVADNSNFSENVQISVTLSGESTQSE